LSTITNRVQHSKVTNYHGYVPFAVITVPVEQLFLLQQQYTCTLIQHAFIVDCLSLSHLNIMVNLRNGGLWQRSSNVCQPLFANIYMILSTLIYMIEMINDLAFDLTICVAWQVSFKIQELLTLREYLGSLPCFGGPVLLNFLCCVWFFLVLCLLCLMLPVSLDCSFLIVPSVFSSVYYYT
jgi:hypothetical protein